MQEVIKKEDNIIRFESLTLPMSTDDGADTTISFESEDPETIQISIGDEFMGLMDMTNFLAFCKRALELWEKEAKESSE